MKTFDDLFELLKGSGGISPNDQSDAAIEAYERQQEDMIAEWVEAQEDLNDAATAYIEAKETYFDLIESAALAQEDIQEASIAMIEAQEIGDIEAYMEAKKDLEKARQIEADCAKAKEELIAAETAYNEAKAKMNKFESKSSN